MRTKIDIENWHRCEIFRFFGAMNDPFTGVVVNIDVTHFYKKMKQEKRSVYLTMMHRILKTVNSIEELRVRIDGDDVFLYDQIHISPTVAREDGSFGFAFFEYEADEARFIEKAKERSKVVKEGSGLMLTQDCGRKDTIHFTCLPWVAFTEFKHARSPSPSESIPKISTGKIFEQGERLLMPVSIWVHHGLADGRHMGLFIQRLEEELCLMGD